LIIKVKEKKDGTGDIYFVFIILRFKKGLE